MLRALFVQLAGRILSLAVRHEDGTLDDDQAKFNLDVMVEEAIYALLGLPRLKAD